MTKDSFAVRAAVPADAAAVAHVHVASREATMPYLPPRRRSDAEVEAWVRDVVMPGSAVWVAVGTDGGIVGYAAVAGDELDALYLLAGARRQGVGSALLGAAKAYRPGGLTLAVFQRNTGCQGLLRAPRLHGGRQQRRIAQHGERTGPDDALAAGDQRHTY